MKIRTTSKPLELSQLAATKIFAELEQARNDRLEPEWITKLEYALSMAQERLATLRDKINTPLEAALKRVNGAAKAHTITSAHDVQLLATRAETELLKRGSKKGSLPGTLVRYRPEAPQAAYKYSAKSTEIELTRTTGGWFLTGVKTIDIAPGEKESFSYFVPPKISDDILRAAFADISVI